MSARPDKRMQFAAEYVKDFNCTQAAIRAGYSPKGAKQNGSRLMTCDDVQKEVARLQAEARSRAAMQQDEAIAILTEIARGKAQDAITLDPRGNLSINIHSGKNERAIAGVEVNESVGAEDTRRVTKVKLRDPVQAIERLAKMLGWDQAQKLDVTGKTKVMVLNIPPREERKPKPEP